MQALRNGQYLIARLGFRRKKHKIKSLCYLIAHCAPLSLLCRKMSRLSLVDSAAPCLTHACLSLLMVSYPDTQPGTLNPITQLFSRTSFTTDECHHRRVETQRGLQCLNQRPKRRVYEHHQHSAAVPRSRSSYTVERVGRRLSPLSYISTQNLNVKLRAM